MPDVQNVDESKAITFPSCTMEGWTSTNHNHMTWNHANCGFLCTYHPMSTFHTAIQICLYVYIYWHIRLRIIYVCILYTKRNVITVHVVSKSVYCYWHYYYYSYYCLLVCFIVIQLLFFEGSLVRKLPSYGGWSWLAFTPWRQPHHPVHHIVMFIWNI